MTSSFPATTFTCPSCKRVSYNRNDAREGYCGFCHDYTEARPTNIIGPSVNTEEWEQFARLFNDLTRAMPQTDKGQIKMLFSQRNMLALAMWDMGYRPPER